MDASVRPRARLGRVTVWGQVSWDANVPCRPYRRTIVPVRILGWVLGMWIVVLMTLLLLVLLIVVALVVMSLWSSRWMSSRSARQGRLLPLWGGKPTRHTLHTRSRTRQ